MADFNAMAHYQSVALTANKTLTAADQGVVQDVTLDGLTVTLPAVAAGLTFIVRNKARTNVNLPAGAVANKAAAVTVVPNGTDTVTGNGFTPAAGKGAVNTKATAQVGDFIKLVGATGTWNIEEVSGVWARVAQSHSNQKRAPLLWGVFLMVSLYNQIMASEKLLQIQKDTTARLEKQAELERQTKNHQDVISLLQSIKQNDTTLTQALIGFLSGHTTKTEIVNQLKSVSTPDVDKVVVAVGKLEELVASKDVDFAPVVEALRAVEAQLEQIPKEHQELPESKEVDFAETNKRLDAVLKAIQSLDLVVEAPKVDVKVPKAQVNVEKVDLTEIKQPLLDILSAFQSFEIPEQLPTDLSTVEDLLKKSNELLKKIKEKPVGGGGGGGGMVPFKDPVTDMSVQVPLTSVGSLPILSAEITERYDIQGSIIYEAYALPSTPESAASWTIKKYDLSSTPYSAKIAINAIWDNRAMETYL